MGEPSKPDPYSMEAKQIPMEAHEDVMPDGTDAEHPLEIWLPKSMLRVAIGESIESIVSSRVALDDNLEDFEESEQMLEQRRKFVQWLDNHPLTHVFVALVPLRSTADDTESVS